MKECMDDNELLRLWAATAGEFEDQRAHLAQCSRCTENYGQVAGDADTITTALTAASDHLPRRESAAVRSFRVRVGDGLRTAAIFAGAAAFGGAAAFALLIALGWQPAGGSTRFANAAENAIVAKAAAGNRTTSADTAIAANESPASSMANGSIYAVDSIESDPLSGLTNGDSVQAGNLNPGEDLLFCVPDDDGAICSSSDEQG